MSRRQTMPKQWLIIVDQPDWGAIQRLPRKAGVIVLSQLTAANDRRLRNVARVRDLRVEFERTGAAARVHSMRELRQVMLRRIALILLSPIYPTASHPDWLPMSRMRAATFARLAGRQAIALGGMNHRRFAKIAPLGFIGWAGVSAFRT
jgi:thiamine-phosphate pyrophosphorylase